MRNKTMLFGPVGRQVEIPCPESGMNFAGNLDTEETKLLSGGLAVYRAPTTFKTYGMSWKGGTKGLQPIIDMHAGAYGQGPFYLTDPLAVGENLLPTRWASSWQLAHVAGLWGNPTGSNQNYSPEGQQSVFTAVASTPQNGPSIVVPTIPGKPIYLKVWGTATGTACVRVSRHNASTGEWEFFLDYIPKTTGHDYQAVIREVEGVDGTYDAVRLTLGTSAANGAGVLSIGHMELSTTMSDDFRMGRGVGALQFTGNAAGTINSAVFDRIGMSIDLKEVQRDPNN